MTRDIRQNMQDYLPRYYDDSRIVANVLDRGAAEFSAVNAEVQAVLDQFFIDTATYGLTRWETICGITTDLAKPIDQRRAMVKSKIRGIGTVTVSLIKSVAEAYQNGEVGVTEDNANYTIKITFIGNRGIPPNLTDTQTVLRDLIPAHLGIQYVFTYLLWDEWDGANKTWSQLDSLNLTWDMFDSYKP